jgi:hypothetical protein
MPDCPSCAVAERINRLRHSHPMAPVVDLFDLVFQEGPRDGLSCTAAQIGPRTPLGQLIAEAFDDVMTPQQWAMATSPHGDPLLRDALMQVWQTWVLPRFCQRYGLPAAV